MPYDPETDDEPTEDFIGEEAHEDAEEACDAAEPEVDEYYAEELWGLDDDDDDEFECDGTLDYNERRAARPEEFFGHDDSYDDTWDFDR